MTAPSTPADRFALRTRARRGSDFADDVLRGLTAEKKQLQPQYFYDPLGSALFGAICELPEYYVTRAETEILQKYAGEIAAAAESVDRLIELGSGNGQKTRLLLEAVLARQPQLLYQPIDVDAEGLRATGRALLTAFPTIAVEALSGEYADVANLGSIRGRTLVIFLGSSIGNLDAGNAAALLREVRRVMSSGDPLIVGFDLLKDRATLEAAYDDALGVTAAFNLNLLGRLNRELGAHFDLSAFAHKAFFNEAKRRIEMHLVSKRAQTVAIDALGADIAFAEGETIHTENSHKYSLDDVRALAAAAGFEVERHWTDRQGWFADVLLRA
jgi:dimethylhistidine N-methyltransferase